MQTDSKIVKCSQLSRIRRKFEMEEKKTVLATGCFDLLHLGHMLHLSYCRQQGDALIVGIVSDRIVSEMKGQDRPFMSQRVRARTVAALGCVDAVVVFGERDDLVSELGEVIAGLRPDAYVVPRSTQWLKERADLCGRFGVRLVTCRRLPPAEMRDGISTTLLARSILLVES